jgi:AraC-like DNA-binding protein
MAKSSTPGGREYYRYLPVNPGDHGWGVSVTGAGYQPAAPGFDLLPRRRHPPGHFYEWDAGRVLSEYGIVSVTHGAGEFDSHATGLVELEAGDAAILFPGIWHRYRARKRTGWGIHWVHFRGTAPDRLLAQAVIRPDRAVVRAGLDPSTVRAFRDTLDALRAEPPGFVQIAGAKTMEILARLVGAASAVRALPRLQEVVSRARLRLEESPGRIPVVEELINEFDVSRTHFFRLFKEQTGQSPYKYHLELKIRRAGEMLRDSNLTVKQISIALGFRNPYHFSRLFRAKTGTSPREYRHHWRAISSGDGPLATPPA